nr:MAG TPA: hypothetical protein [Caudoviricetes sp.]
MSWNEGTGCRHSPVGVDSTWASSPVLQEHICDHYHRPALPTRVLNYTLSHYTRCLTCRWFLVACFGSCLKSFFFNLYRNGLFPS